MKGRTNYSSAFFWDITQRRVVIVYNYDTTLCNTPEERRSHQHRGGSLKLKFFILLQFSNILFWALLPWINRKDFRWFRRTHLNISSKNRSRNYLRPSEQHAALYYRIRVYFRVSETYFRPVAYTLPESLA
jgi:hypothetical protein